MFDRRSVVPIAVGGVGIPAERRQLLLVSSIRPHSHLGCRNPDSVEVIGEFLRNRFGDQDRVTRLGEKQRVPGQIADAAARGLTDGRPPARAEAEIEIGVEEVLVSHFRRMVHPSPHFSQPPGTIDETATSDRGRGCENRGLGSVDHVNPGAVVLVPPTTERARPRSPGVTAADRRRLASSPRPSDTGRGPHAVWLGFARFFLCWMRVQSSQRQCEISEGGLSRPGRSVEWVPMAMPVVGSTGGRR